uniref:Multiple epidermal growth factor-like domains 10 n=1 Tax=Magallana gigas TaxID=29159 RepID=A0A8W8NP79_MAGGI
MKIGMYHTDILILLADLTLISTYDNLSYNKLATQSLTYVGPSSGASNAVDGNIATCTRQFAIGLTSPHETVWWKVDLGDVYNIYSISILFKTYDGHECIDGMYGLKCLQQCLGHCRDNVTCNHVTGHCDGGCDKGWTAALCDKKCDDGTYGYDCLHNCSGHCLNDSPCTKQTGHCDRGCEPGYTNTDCSKATVT